MSTVSFDTSDLKRLEREMRALPSGQQRIVTKAAGKAARLIRPIVRAKAPEDTGMLKRGIVVKPERSRSKGKKVYEVTMDRNMNDVFQKPLKSGKHAYYPSSQEYGFLTRSKGGGLSYVPGYRYMRDGSEQAEGQAREKMIQTIEEEVEKAWQKK